jgi:hypothetical protein
MHNATACILEVVKQAFTRLDVNIRLSDAARQGPSGNFVSMGRSQNVGKVVVCPQPCNLALNTEGKTLLQCRPRYRCALKGNRRDFSIPTFMQST